MKPKVLLTGAGGNIGYATLQELLKTNKYDITVFDLKSGRNKRKLKPLKDKIRIIYGDISEKRDLLPAIIDQDYIIHLAAVIPPFADDYPPIAYKVNTLGTQNLVELAEMFAPNAFLIYSSSVAIYGDRLDNPYIKTSDRLKPSEGDQYAKTKILAEKIIRKSKLTWTIFRLSAIFGIKNHKIGKILFHMPLETPMEITTVDDTARAFVKALEHKDDLTGKIFNLGGGEKCRILYREFLERSFRIYGLGKLDFPPEAFARANFHCGYYADGDILENILHFRHDTIESYFEQVEKGIGKTQKILTRSVHKTVKNILLKKSEPMKALKEKNHEMIRRFFGKKANLQQINE